VWRSVLYRQQAGTGADLEAEKEEGGCAMIPFTIESYVAWKQPDILRLIWLLWQPVEDDPEFRRLDKLMRQKPWPNAPEKGER
jgi:hypothetical protein